MATNVELSDDDLRALDIARALVKAGVPVFVAPPAPDTKVGFKLPGQWETSAPLLDVVDRWRPGWALCAVGGHAADFIDVDPRNGGAAGQADLVSAGEWPTSYGRARTPNGGTHDVIAPLGVGKGVPATGVDLQGGASDGSGRGFVFIAPTVRRNLATGEPTAYRWEIEPDTDALSADREDDRSGVGLAARVMSKRPTVASTLPAGTGDPFSQPGGTLGAPPATTEETVRRLAGLAVELAAAPSGQGNNVAASVAYRAGQYVGAGQLSPELAVQTLLGALAGWTWERPVDRVTMEQTIRRQVAAGSGNPRAWESAHSASLSLTQTHSTSLNAGQSVAPDVDPVSALMALMLDTDQMDALPPPKPLIRDVLDLDSESWVIGASGSFKSFVAIDWAAHVGTGMPWRGKPVTQGSVLYVAAEGSKGVGLRKRAWEATYERRMTGVTFLPRPVQVSDANGWAVLVEACRRMDVNFIVIDTQARVTVGLDENSAGQMSVLTEAVRQLRAATGACVLVVHHVGRNGGDARGSSAIDAAQDSELRVTRPEKKAARSRLAFEIGMDKQKDGDDSMIFDCQMTVVDLGVDEETGRPLTSLAIKPLNPFDQPTRAEFDHVANLSDNMTLILETLREHADHDGATVPEIRRWTKERRGIDVAASSVRSALRDLEKRGLVEKLTAAGRWALSEHLA